MKIEVVHISGGELESPDAGDPARLIRLRYREAAELVRVRGKMAVLMINDIDAGAGRFDALTQYTVNTQLVNNTLMNIADNPTNVQLPGSYDETEIRRVPIILTGNDLSTLYAPLIRDGRMEKFYWEPDREDRIGIVAGIFEPDELSKQHIVQLVDAFPDQAIDFFGAVRSQIYNEQVRDFIFQVGLENLSLTVVNTTSPPQFRKPDFSLSHLMEVGYRLVREQRRVTDSKLATEYNRVLQQTVATHDPSAGQDNFYRAYEGASGSLSPTTGPAVPVDGQTLLSHRPTTASPGSSATACLPADTLHQVHTLVNQGYRVGLEHVDQRRFQTNAWKSCAPIQSQDPDEAAAALQQCVVQYPNEYVRMIGIDPKSKQRVMEQIIQRP